MKVLGRSLRAHATLFAAGAALLFSAPSAFAQTKVPGFALEYFEPSSPGDAFFGVSAPWVGGHLVPRGAVWFDYAQRPFQLEFTSAGTTSTTDVVAQQGFLRVDASFALWDRLLFTVDVPIVLLASGQAPAISGLDFHPPSGAAIGDIRLDLRGRIFGDYHDIFQLGASAAAYVPSGSQDAYTGDGSARGVFRLLLGGRAGRSVGFVWSANGGVQLRSFGDAHAFVFGAAAGLSFFDERIIIGPEMYGSARLGGSLLSLSGATTAAEESKTSLEVLGGARARIVSGLTIGAAAGAGPLTAIGTPEYRVIGMLAWAPAPERPAEKPAPVIGDKDDDGIRDDVDACPDVKGELQSDPSKDGCPPADRDGDTVLDVEDACPSEAGLRNPDATKNGCPLDTDEDGISDAKDACVEVRGAASADPKKNGCPGDQDDDGIADVADVCPNIAGPASPDKKENGCPADRDNDGIKNAQDACPDDPGVANTADPKQHGCPKLARLSGDEIVISQQVRFIVSGRLRHETVDPVSDDLLREIKAIIDKNPKILKVEVQGHTDDSGSEEHNLTLSQQRADAVRTWLINAGVPASKLVAKGYGFTKPIGDNRVKTGRAANRRVEFVVLEKTK